MRLRAWTTPQQGQGNHLSVLEEPMEVRGLNVASLPPTRRSGGPGWLGWEKQTLEVGALLPGV